MNLRLVTFGVFAGQCAMLYLFLLYLVAIYLD
jgi:hypothetical protein